MSKNDSRMMNDHGFSLLELIVVLGIASIVLSMAVGFGHDYMVRSQVEGFTQEMFADLMSARVNALQKNRTHLVTLAANQYAIYQDTFPTPDGNEAPDTGSGEDMPVKQKTTTYPINALASGVSLTYFGFNSCGLVSELAQTPEASYIIRVVTTSAPSFDCIVIKPTRLLMGRWNGTDCIVQ